MEIAIVGTGNVAENNYLPSLLAHEDVTLSCYSRTLARTEALAQKFDIRVASSLEALFEPEPEAVFVLTREEQRLQATQALLPFKPKRLFLEKPLVARHGQAKVVEQDFWDGKALLEQAQAGGSEVAMVFNYRFFEQIQRAKTIIEERNFGPLVNVTALAHYACWSHCIDLILYFGGPLQEISAQEGQQTHPFGKDMYVADVSAAFVLSEGATGTILGTSAMAWEYPLFELTLNFEGGRIHFRGLDQNLEVLDYVHNQHEVFSPSRQSSRWDKYKQSFSASVSAYLDSIRTNSPPPVPGLAGLLELQFEAGLKKSIADEKKVVVAEVFPVEH